jgi:hypothetical protein
MHDILWIIIAILIICFGIYFEFSSKNEYFNDSDSETTIDTKVINIYQEMLSRYPTRVELIEQRRAIESGKRSYDDIRQRIIDSDEYNQNMKLQSNALTPELPRMVSDSRLLQKLTLMYKEIRLKTCPAKMVLPLKDIYIKLDYNDDALRYMLRSESWAVLEQDILLDDNFNASDLDNVINRSFGSIEEIKAEAASQPGAAKTYSTCARIDPELNKARSAGVCMNTSGGIYSGRVNGVFTGSLVLDDCPYAAVPQATGNTGSEAPSTSASASTPGSAAATAATASAAATAAATATTPATAPATTASASAPASTDPSSCIQSYLDNSNVKIPVHTNDMVLRPEFAWAVPQPYPPVCTTLRQPAPTQPVVLESSLTLNATTLDEANQTGVGSIMPKFEYKEYV